MLNDLTDSIGSFLKKIDLPLFEKSKQYPLMIKFSASWCGPCKWLQKTIELLKIKPPSEVSNFSATSNRFFIKIDQKDLLFLEVDIEKYPSLRQEFNINITSLPTSFLFFKEKVIGGPQSGRMDLLKLKEFVKI